MEVEELRVRLEREYGQFRWRRGKKFMFRALRTIVYEEFSGDGVSVEELVQGRAEYDLRLLHELGHALLGHRDFGTDLQRLVMERQAWEKAEELCRKYGVAYDEGFMQGELDSYRDWLHVRARCRKCGLTRYQTEDGKYHCPSCEMYGLDR